MALNEKQLQQAEQALAEKNEASKQRNDEEARVEAETQSLIGTHRQQDDYSVRAKSSGHGKKTADKWNQ